MPDSWKSEYPRLFDLFEHSNQDHQDNKLSRFSEKFATPLARQLNAELEKRLSLLSENAWIVLRQKALHFVVKKEESRGYSQLSEILNESTAIP